MRSFLLFAATLLAITNSFLHAQTTYTFAYTGTVQTYTVPANIALISVTVSGAQGGGGAAGAVYTQTLAVTPGQVLNIYVGGAGSVGSFAAGGYNGGGQAGGSYNNEGSGGGASDIRVSPYALSNRIIVAGGGGGNGGYAGGAGGSGGLVGLPGGAGQGGAGLGGSATAGGAGGSGNGCGSGASGTLGIGGAGGSCNVIGGGGGGGGYYGGGGGGGDNNYCCADGGGAGGGSSYSSVSGGVCTTGARYGNGEVIIRELNGFSISQISPVVCNGGLTAALAATVSGGVAPYTFSWSTGATTSSISNLGAGTYTCWVTSASSQTYSGTYVVTQPPILYSSISSQWNVYCNGGNNGYLSAYAWGGVQPYSYSWSPYGGNTSWANNLTAGNYSCFVTDANGCVSVVSATVTQPAAPAIVAFATSSAVCLGQTVTLVAGGAQSYSWNNGVFNNVPFTPTATANYVVTGYDAQGCPGYAQTSVIVNPVPTVAVSSGSLVCPGAAVTLSASGASSYSWSSGGLSASTVVNPSVNTIYTVTGTNSYACEATATVGVNVYTSTPIGALISNTVVCSGGTVSMLGTGAISFTWSGNFINGMPFVPAASTVYTLFASDQNACIRTATYAIQVNPLPPVAISGNSVICQGDSSALSASGANSYTWNTGAQTTSITVTPPTSSVLSVSGTDQNGCINTANFNLQVTPLPPVNIQSGSNLLCIGRAMTLLANGASSYTWLPMQINSVSVSVNPTITSSYTLVGSANGCSNSAPFTVSIIPLPTLSVSGPTAAVCALNTVTLSASGASTYSWSTGVSSQSLAVVPAITTVYTVTGTGNNGCSKDDTVRVWVKPLPSLSITNLDSLVCPDETTTLTVSGALSYTWSTSDTTQSIVVSVPVNTGYWATGVGANGCSNTISYQLIVSPCSGISEQDEAGLRLLVYPNPSSGSLHISAHIDLRLYLRNSLGQLIQEIRLNDGNQYTAELSSLSQGIYFLSGEKNGKVIQQKIIVTK